MLEEIAWLMNIRMSGQHEFDPLFNAQLMVTETEAFLFLEPEVAKALNPKLLRGLVQFAPIKYFDRVIKSKLQHGTKVGFDSGACSQFNFDRLSAVVGAENMINFEGPKSLVSKHKIIKTSIELSGLRTSLTTESLALMSTYAEIKKRI